MSELLPDAQQAGFLDPRRALEFLARASAVLARSLDYERTLQAAVQLAVPELADWCAIDVIEPDGSLRQLTSGHPDPKKEALLVELRRRYRREKGAAEGVRHVIETGESELMTDVHHAPRMELRDEERELYEELSPRSYIIVPLVARGRTTGALTLLTCAEGRHYGPTDLDFAHHLARRFGLAADNARLYREAQEARERLECMASASALLSASLDLEETLQQVADLAVPRIGDWCSIELREDDGSFRNVAVAHVDPAKVELARQVQQRYPTPADAPTGVPNVIRTGRSELYSDLPDELIRESVRDEEHLRLIRELGPFVSGMVVPLTARGSTLGALTLITTESRRRYGDEDLAVAEDLARRAAMAVDNARLYSREHEAALTLQRSLLPRELPRVPRLEFATRYLPATAEVDVGGDWYDAMPLEGGRVAVAIGDVAGHGVEAAAAMGQLTNALRAYALEGHPPDIAVERLNHLSRTFEQHEMATLVYLILDPEAGRLTFVRAGHPPPLVALPDGSVTRLGGEGSLPVGVLPNASYVACEAPLPPGSTLLLYTDGLIERRDEPLRVGLERLEKALVEAPEELEALCNHVLSRMAPEPERDDDIAMLALRSLPVELAAASAAQESASGSS